jgi:hypothetical protein
VLDQESTEGSKELPEFLGDKTYEFSIFNLFSTNRRSVILFLIRMEH